MNKTRIILVIIIIVIIIATICIVKNVKIKNTTQTALIQSNIEYPTQIQDDNDEELERIIVILNKDDKKDDEPQEENEAEVEQNYDLDEDDNNQTNDNTDNTNQTNSSNDLNTNGDSESNYTQNNYIPNTYYIKVNYGANTVTVYTYDDEGQYTIPVKAMTCSTGSATPTQGKYPIKERWEWLDLVGNVYGHYSTQIVGNILFHSVPYLEKGNPGSLEYWEYDKLRHILFCWLCKAYYC